ncbi:zinc finger MYM-type protein 1-like isoform X2 [Triplophysa rosa]|uniref:zinc finger MYM-type protein 1-like isoform X2 n=1 Tax=Triplophysa rosa TaxID=992332 RepID=UPI00254639D6|nr:zinc finger MYM-type protein 1-like isoform X2 [Triplophysa rosa]
MWFCTRTIRSVNILNGVLFLNKICLMCSVRVSVEGDRIVCTIKFNASMGSPQKPCVCVVCLSPCACVCVCVFCTLGRLLKYFPKNVLTAGENAATSSSHDSLGPVSAYIGLFSSLSVASTTSSRAADITSSSSAVASTTSSRAADITLTSSAVASTTSSSADDITLTYSAVASTTSSSAITEGAFCSANVSAVSRDPADWPEVLSGKERAGLVIRGPSDLNPNFKFPKRQDGRSFHFHYKFRLLTNGEKIQRTWLVYSMKSDAVFCWCCKLFSKGSSKLITEGQRDWTNIGAILKQHENSPAHIKSVVSWKELELGLKKGQTIDHTQLTLTEAEKRRWREVLIRLIAIIKSLAERNLAFRGSEDKLMVPNNGNFLKEVELMAKFDPVLREHIRLADKQGNHTTYLGKTIQNELISCIGDQLVKTMVAGIQESKYFSIILDCTPDVSHTEQMSVVARTVSLEKGPEIKEYFLGFLDAPDSTGAGLSSLILKRLEELGIPFSNCRGQSYDNGANMRGKNKGVQARLLEKNPRALYVPCGSHTLNLVVADAAKESIVAINFFGVVQKLFTLFAAAPQRWAILKDHADITLKSWSDTRWESRVKSIEPLQHQPEKVREALLQVRENTKDPTVRIEAQSLAEEIGSFRFQICLVVWYNILRKINVTSKLLQSATMQLDVAVDLIHQTKASLVSYRATGFNDAVKKATERCEEMNVQALLKEKRLRTMKRHFSYEAADEPESSALKKMEVSFFNVVVDCAIQTLEDRFSSMGKVRDNFGVLNNFQNLDTQTIRYQCEQLGRTLSTGNESDLDWKDLVMELESLPTLPKDKMTALELLAFLHDKDICELYPNLWVALRISCTLPVTVASAERSFSKLKLIKTYLRSSMAQERLNALAIISINHEVGSQLSYDDVINDFASKKTRRARI